MNYINSVKKYFSITKQEKRGILITTLVLALIISFDQWGTGQTFELKTGLTNLIIAIILGGITILTHHTAQKLTGIHFGIKAEQKIFGTGTILSLIITTLTNGAIKIYTFTGLYVEPIKEQRLGKPRKEINMWEYATVALAGPLANIILATLIKTLQIWFDIVIYSQTTSNQIFVLNWSYALYNLLPIPPLDGSRIFYFSRQTYVFLLGTILGYFILYAFDIYSYIFALIIGFITWLTYYIMYEKK